MNMLLISVFLILVAGTFVRSLDNFYGHTNREIEHAVEVCASGLLFLLWICTPLNFAQAGLTVSIILCVTAIPITIYLKKRKKEEECEFAFSEFLHILSSLLAKVYNYEDLSESDIRAIEGVFNKLELTDSQIDFCVETFRQCEDRDLELYEILGGVEDKFDKELLGLLYELLWEVVSKSTNVSEEKLDVLKTVARMLHLPLGTYEKCKQEFLSRHSGFDEDSSSSELSLEEAYQELECNGGETDEELKGRYRELVKQYHPDVLISKGLPKELMDVAKRKMVRLNEAWDIVARTRTIS